MITNNQVLIYLVILLFLIILYIDENAFIMIRAFSWLQQGKNFENPMFGSKVMTEIVFMAELCEPWVSCACDCLSSFGTGSRRRRTGSRCRRTGSHHRRTGSHLK